MGNTGVVKSAELCKPIGQVHISRINSLGLIIEKTITNDHGEWQLLNIDQTDTVVFERAGFVTKQFPNGFTPEIVRLLEDRLIGYQDKLWFIPGEDVSIYIHSSVVFQCILYRHGILKEAILMIRNQNPCIQNVPDNFFVDTGLNWQKTCTYRIPENATPGIYSLLLEAKDQENFAIPMVVSTPSKYYGKRSKLLVLASTNTWQQYNLWGGRSRYRNFENEKTPDYSPVPEKLSKIIVLRRKLGNRITSLIRRKSVEKEKRNEWMHKKITIRRPFTSCALEDDTACRPFTNHLAAGEWRLLAWLEREKIAYDIVSGYELHKNPELLQNYMAILLSTHSEYWSKEMFDGLKHFHEQKKLWILNVSGNSIYRQIDFYDDGSTYCVSTEFSSYADETQLLGVRYRNGDYGTCASYQILMPDHWTFANIPIQVKYFGGLSLNQITPKKSNRYDPGRPGYEGYGLVGMGASGWELDKLSETAPEDCKLIAKGLNPNGGADMVIREPSGTRGGLFSASSIVYGGALLIDEIASLVLNNVISKALAHDL